MLRLTALALAALLVTGCVAKRQAEEREAMLFNISHKFNVAYDPYGLKDPFKYECHDRIRSDIISRYARPNAWDVYKELALMEKATHAYAKRVGYQLADPEDPEVIPSNVHTAFFMTEYIGEDFVGVGTTRQYVCTFERNPTGTYLMSVASSEGFKRAMNLPDTRPSAW